MRGTQELGGRIGWEVTNRAPPRVVRVVATSDCRYPAPDFHFQCIRLL